MRTELVESAAAIVLISGVLVWGARRVLLEPTRANRRINAGLLIGCACIALRDARVSSAIAELAPGVLTVDRLYLLSEQAIIVFAATYFLVGCSWLVEREPAFLAPLTYGFAACAVVFEIVVGLVARSHDAVPGLNSGWAIVATSTSPLVAASSLVAHNGFLYWMALTWLYLAARELRRRPSGREMAICLGVAAFATVLSIHLTAITVAALEQIGGRHSAFTAELARNDNWSSVLYVGAVMTMCAVPVGRTVGDRLHYDRASRLRRRLVPLWRELTTACPEVVHPDAPGLATERSRYLLHRTVIEVRDCMLMLSRPPVGGSAGELPGRSDMRTALRIAIRAATYEMVSRGRASDEPSDLWHDAEQLCLVASYWPQAKLRVATRAAGRNEVSPELRT